MGVRTPAGTLEAFTETLKMYNDTWKISLLCKDPVTIITSSASVFSFAFVCNTSYDLKTQITAINLKET